MKVELDLSHYEATVDLKNAEGVDTSDFATKMRNVPSILGNLKIKVDKLDVDKLVLVPVEKIKHNEDKTFDITNLATNASLNAKINDLKNDMPSITNLATTTTALHAKINEVEKKIPNTLNLATNTAFTAVENNILDHYK